VLFYFVVLRCLVLCAGLHGQYRATLMGSRSDSTHALQFMAATFGTDEEAGAGQAPTQGLASTERQAPHHGSPRRTATI
jgi:hypothetical protein